jgi:rare lipoprotein A (peptidoglycan hydrolase)
MKTKTKKRLKHLHHVATRRKLVKKKASLKFARGFFVLVIAICTGSLALAITHVRPLAQIGLEANLKPRSISSEPVNTGADQVGIASWYALGLRSPDAHTCASTKFPRGTYLSVRNLRNSKSVVCLVNDYGPEAWTKRAIDLSRGSFIVIEDLSRGTTPVEIKVVPPPPSGINIPLPSNFSQFNGYSLCHRQHSKRFCENNRQKIIQLKDITE